MMLLMAALLPTWASEAQVVFDAPAEDRPLFPNLRAGGGANLLQDAQLDSFTYTRRQVGTNTPADDAVSALFPAGSDVQFDPGPALGIALGGGMRMPDWLHVEVETGFSLNAFKFEAGGAAFEGDLWQIPAAVNLTVPWQVSRSFDVFGGLGLGVVFGVLDLDPSAVQVRTLPGAEEFVTIEGTRFTGVGMAQAFGGLRYRLNAASALSLSYRFRGTTPPRWTGKSSLDGQEGEWELDLSRLYSHTVSLMYELKW
jgi:hypothetical protein